MKFRCKNLLVTGGAGFIGSNFINHIIKKYPELKIYNLDLLTYAGNLENTKEFKIKKNYYFFKADICDSSAITKIFKNAKIDGVINFAAETHVDNSIHYPSRFIKTNIDGVANLLKICNNFWMDKYFKPKEEYKHARFHQVSTDEVYGSINNGSFTEKSSYNPNSPYSASKASADHLVRAFNKTYGLNTTISHSSNNYGYKQNVEKLIPKSIYNIRNNFPVELYGNGLNIRDWIYVLDNCEAIDYIFNLGKSGDNYNVGSGCELSNYHLIKMFYELLEKKENIKYVDDRPGHDYRYSLNCEKIKSELNWHPKTNITDFFKKNIKKLN